VPVEEPSTASNSEVGRRNRDFRFTPESELKSNIAACPKCAIYERGNGGRCSGGGYQKAKAVGAASLLRPCSQRPRSRCSPDKRHELASQHVPPKARYRVYSLAPCDWAASEKWHPTGLKRDHARCVQGQKRKWPRLNGMSVLPSGADILRPPLHVRFVPIVLKKSFWVTSEIF
jgi:hypothetical protein